MNFRKCVLAIWACQCLFTLTACMGGFPAKIGSPVYSEGPVSEPDFPSLVRITVPADEGELHVFGKASWLGFKRPGSVQWTEPHFSGVVVLAEQQILLLLWNGNAQNYEIVERVPYSAIRFRAKREDFSGYLEIDLMGRGLSIGTERFLPLMTTYLGFENAAGSGIDRERNRQAHAWFETKVEHIPTDETRDDTLPTDRLK